MIHLFFWFFSFYSLFIQASENPNKDILETYNNFGVLNKYSCPDNKSTREKINNWLSHPMPVYCGIGKRRELLELILVAPGTTDLNHDLFCADGTRNQIVISRQTDVFKITYKGRPIVELSKEAVDQLNTRVNKPNHLVQVKILSGRFLFLLYEKKQQTDFAYSMNTRTSLGSEKADQEMIAKIIGKNCNTLWASHLNGSNSKHKSEVTERLDAEKDKRIKRLEKEIYAMRCAFGVLFVSVAVYVLFFYKKVT